MFCDISQTLEALSSTLDSQVNGTQNGPSTSSGHGGGQGSFGGFEQSHSIQQLAQHISAGMQSQPPVQSQTSLNPPPLISGKYPDQFESLASQQMQQIQQMRMLQSLGQYSQLGLSGFNPSFGQGYQSEHHQGAPQSQGMHNEHEFNEPKHDFDKNHLKSTKIDEKMGKLGKDGKKKRKKTSNVKRPTTAYLYFVSKYRERIKAAGEPMPKAKEMMQECAAKWRNMNVEEKSPYQKLADVDKERWQTEKAAEKKPKDQYRPKRPPSAYFLFLRDFRENWKAEHEEELRLEEEAKQARARLKEEEEKSEKPTTPPEDGDATQSSEHSANAEENADEPENTLQIDESSSNNNKPEVGLEPTTPTTTPTPLPLTGGKKEKPPRKMSRVVEITKKAGEKWNSMTDEDKAPYVAKAQATRLKWEKELQIYKHELKNGKTGEEASNRLTELGDAGEDALDDFCSEINQQAAAASAEKKIKLEKPVEKTPPADPVTRDEVKQESVSPAPPPASTPPAQNQVFSPPPTQQQSPSTPVQHMGTPEQAHQQQTQQHHLEQHHIDQQQAAAAAQQHDQQQQQQQQQHHHHQQLMQQHHQPYAHHYGQMAQVPHQQHEQQQQQQPPGNSGQFGQISYEGWNHQMYPGHHPPPPPHGGHPMN